MATLAERIKELGWWYQPMVYGDVKVPCKYHGDPPATYGIGKWNNYIKPLLEGIDEGDFCDMGCNAGLHLLAAREMGFNRVWGIEGDKRFYKQALLTSEYYDKDLRIINAQLGGSFKLCNFPIVNVTLLCNFYYWVDIDALIKYIKELACKSLYVIVVTSESCGSSEQVKQYFSGWELLRTVKTKDTSDGRRNLTGMLFKSNQLIRYHTEDIFKAMVGQRNRDLFEKSFRGFCEQILRGENVIIEESRVYKDLASRLGKEQALRRASNWSKWILDIRDNGQKTPIQFIEHDYDGYHRIAMLKYTNQKYVYGLSHVSK